MKILSPTLPLIALSLFLSPSLSLSLPLSQFSSHLPYWRATFLFLPLLLFFLSLPRHLSLFGFWLFLLITSLTLLPLSFISLSLLLFFDSHISPASDLFSWAALFISLLVFLDSHFSQTTLLVPPRSQFLPLALSHSLSLCLSLYQFFSHLPYWRAIFLFLPHL